MEETNNNLEEAKIWLKKKGFKEAENRMARSANTNLYGLKLKDNKIVVSSLSCETDFVSSTDLFQNYLNIVLDFLMENKRNKVEEKDLDSVKIVENEYNKSFNNLSLLEGLKNLISKTQENCKLGVCEKFDYTTEKDKVIFGTYLHSSPQNNICLGAKAAFVILEFDNEGKNLSSDQKKKLTEIADNLSMQVVASAPKYLNRSDIPSDILEHENKILKEQIVEANSKSEKKVDIDKVLASKMNSWFEEIVLNEQNYVIVDHESSEGKTKVGNLVSKIGKDLGLKSLQIRDFRLFA